MTLLQSGAEELVAAALVPWIAAAVLGLGTLTVLGAAVVQPGRRRLPLAVGVVSCGLLAVAHGALALGVHESLGLESAAATAVARLAGYVLVLALVLGLLGRAAGLRRWAIAALGAAAALHVAALAGWVLTDGDLAIAALAAAGLLALAGAYGVAVAVRRGGPRARRLLVVRLAGLVGLVWTVAVFGLGLSPLGASVLDGYTATVLGGYLDVLFGTGVGALLATSGDALDELTGATTPTGVADAVAAPAPDDDQRGVEPAVGDDATVAGEDSAVASDDSAPVDDSAAAGDGGTVAEPSTGTGDADESAD